MEKKYVIKEYKPMNSNNQKLNDSIKEYIVRSCLNVANKAKFKTDYDDVKDHLFEKDEYIKLFVVEETSDVVPDIKGFLVCDTFYGYKGMEFLHCHGIVLSPEIQELGWSKKLVNYAIEMTNPDVVTAKTHNPRFFNSMINLEGAIAYYPNESGEIPTQIKNLAKTDPFISKSDANLVYKDAYPDEKIQQSNRDIKVNTVFNNVATNDAQSIIVILNDEKLNAKRLVKDKS